MSKKKLLWCGDAAVSTGFARCTHEILEVLRQEYDVYVLGVNYSGDPHGYPYDIFPAIAGGDPWGLTRLVPLLESIRPDVLFVQQDTWNVPKFLAKAGNIPVIASMTVDGKNVKGKELNGLAHAIFWTNFGKDEAIEGGYQGRYSVQGMGIRTESFRPIDTLEARKALQLPEYVHNSFIVGNVNRNQPRKRLDLCVAAFAFWITQFNIQDAYLYMHVTPTNLLGCDVKQLADYYGISSRLIYSEANIAHGVPEEELVHIYNCFDVQITTTQGEGWGLPTMEGMACGIPQMIPDWSALGEWAKSASLSIPCKELSITPQGINMIGAVPTKGEIVDCLNVIYQNQELRDRLSAKGMELASHPRFKWENVGQHFLEVTDSVVRRSELHMA